MATIVEAIKVVLTDYPEGLTSVEIYNKIIEKDLYKFNAISPQAIVNGTIRRHCYGLNFSTARPEKYFIITSNQRGKSKYALYDESVVEDIEKVISVSVKEQLPEEKMGQNYSEHISFVKEQLMNAILNASPRFFEELVVELLMKMGYGYDGKAGKVTQLSRDGGIDGIIEEDKLGLDKIYIQAKRYNINHKIDTATVDQFRSVMGKNSVTKGVFITTSSFVEPVKAECSKPVDGKIIRLIDGNELMDYLIKYELGVNNVKTYKTFVLDENYFNQQ